MSLNANTSHVGGSFGQIRTLPFKLDNAGHYTEWRRHLQAAAFAMFRNADLSQLTVEQTIDTVQYAEKHPKFSAMFQLLPVATTLPVVQPVVQAWAPPLGIRPLGEPIKPVMKKIKVKVGGNAYQAEVLAYELAKVAYDQLQESWYQANPNWRPPVNPVPNASPPVSGAVVPVVRTLQNVLKNEEYKHWLDEVMQDCLTTGSGFFAWTYQFWFLIESSISANIASETAGVSTGDVIQKLKSIQLAVSQVEHIDHYELYLLFVNHTMADTNNNYNVYDAKMVDMMRRLMVAGHPVDPKLAQMIYIRGLTTSVFADIKNDFDKEKPLTSTFKEMRDRVLTFAVRKENREKLASFVPRAEHINFQAAQLPNSPKTVALASMQAQMNEVMMLLKESGQGGKKVSQSVGSKKLCHDFAKSGKCNFGTNCKFSHVVEIHANAVGTIQGKYCSFHRSKSHSDAECKSQKPSQKPEPLLVAIQEKEALASDFEEYMFMNLSCTTDRQVALKECIAIDSGATCHAVNSMQYAVEGSRKSAERVLCKVVSSSAPI